MESKVSIGYIVTADKKINLHFSIFSQLLVAKYLNLQIGPKIHQ